MNNILLAGGGNGALTNPIFKGTIFESLLLSEEGGTLFLGKILPNIIGLLLVFGVVTFFFMLLWGAVSWIISGGDKAHIESAKARITSALIGLVLMLSTFAIVKLIEAFFGIDILSIDIGPLVIQ
ncbi:MAG: hypothetical protein UR39_C0017G0009 [Candidatus Woesebacteria bacterium GW2011_GWA1_33_30]|uniref:Uncharacterized protein n=1 Tax=Candidatus Woesebacteria bacterium GW2011_GWA2_33_28 TaxID=1618561 RepID=A0A0G0CRI0_9BACT|nr:MAG: hypothetical protein UR38_C0015G0009 [Candidatus Woesebacteria bacterium GW2011_GWA2_33_28]KKP46343.1 MAG: hypothetical protein UR39_C0017G0009 [Candidatus Woesebacteria bacterium GW2011_GWA1_33_30]KKP47838.1 MAG: hypothetical protein UR40_C0017G0009 [Microgenomates group bacterium GW2011_GWC1_33_32]KKP51276.1 MAG: hypothetical protein UR44_C0014G0009 [Candidatus Woesebacteria bacterium GW2011_GWB1_33_38]